MQRLEAILHIKARWLLVIAATAALTMTALVVIASVMRYLVGKPFAFTEELVALLYVTMQFLTIPLCTLKRQHINITILTEKVRPAVGRLLAVAANFLTAIFCTWFIWEAYKFTAFSHQIGSRSEQVEFLLWPWMALMPFAVLVTLVISVIQTVNSIQDALAGRDAPGPDEAVGDGT